MRVPMQLKVLVLPVLLGVSVTSSANEVAREGQTSKTKLEQVVAGHLVDLNGKYKLRASEVTYTPGGFIGEHHHAGPGIRCVTGGELTYVQAEKTTAYKAGDCFFESGDVTHTAKNMGTVPVVLINFEILPVDWSGPSTIPVPR